MQALNIATKLFKRSLNQATHLSCRTEHIQAKMIVMRSPYEELRVELDPKENPIKVNAYGDERTIACVCDDMYFMTLKKGPPMKCKCGYWFQLVDANKFWLKKNAKNGYENHLI